MLTGDKYSLGKTPPTVPLVLSLQVGQGDIPSFSPLSIYLAVQTDFEEDSFPSWIWSRVQEAGPPSVLAAGASIRARGSHLWLRGRDLGLRRSFCHPGVSCPWAVGVLASGRPALNHPLGAPPRLPNFNHPHHGFCLSTSHPHDLHYDF